MALRSAGDDFELSARRQPVEEPRIIDGGGGPERGTWVYDAHQQEPHLRGLEHKPENNLNPPVASASPSILNQIREIREKNAAPLEQERALQARIVGYCVEEMTLAFSGKKRLQMAAEDIVNHVMGEVVRFLKS